MADRHFDNLHFIFILTFWLDAAMQCPYFRSQRLVVTAEIGKVIKKSLELPLDFAIPFSWGQVSGGAIPYLPAPGL